MEEECLAIFKNSGCYHIILLLASCWPKLRLLAIVAMETQNCLYFSSQPSFLHERKGEQILGHREETAKQSKNKVLNIRHKR